VTAKKKLSEIKKISIKKIPIKEIPNIVLDLKRIPDKLRITSLELKIIELTKLIGKLSDKVKTYDPDNMLEMEQRHADLSSMFQSWITKITVVTEVAYFARNTKNLTNNRRLQLLAAVVFCIDQPNEFWQHHNRSVFDWAQVVLACYYDNKMLDIVNDQIDTVIV